MKTRIEQELALIRSYYPDIEVQEKEGRVWVKKVNYPLPSGWNLEATEVAFNFPPGFPGNPPYGIYVPDSLLFNQKSALTGCQFTPPFEGNWGMISWTPDGIWKPNVNIVGGTNMLNFLKSFSDFFKEGIK